MLTSCWFPGQNKSQSKTRTQIKSNVSQARTQVKSKMATIQGVCKNVTNFKIQICRVQSQLTPLRASSVSVRIGDF